MRRVALVASHGGVHVDVGVADAFRRTEKDMPADVTTKLAILEALDRHGGTASLQQIADLAKSGTTSPSQAALRKDLDRLKDAVVRVDANADLWRLTPDGRRQLLELRESQDVDEEDELSAEPGEFAIREPYDPSQIKVDLVPLSAFQVMRKMQLGEIDLQPDFQRHIVWDETRQSRLIESMLIRIPLPAFYLDARDESKWLVVDGLQRLSTLDRFYNKKSLTLTNLEFLPELEGKTFDQLPRKFQRQIEDSTILNLYLIRPDTPPRVKFTIFYRINTGGLVLTAQEIRHALFQGTATTLLKQLAATPEFLQATTGSVSTTRMDDRECVLRFLAFFLQPYTAYRTSDLHGFLSEAMQRINGMSNTEITRLEGAFKKAMTNAQLVFREYAFRKIYVEGGRRAPINKSLFEVWSTCLYPYEETALREKRDEILKSFIQLMNDDYKFNQDISQGTGSVRAVQRRFSKIEQLVQRVVGS